MLVLIDVNYLLSIVSLPPSTTTIQPSATQSVSMTVTPSLTVSSIIVTPTATPTPSIFPCSSNYYARFGNRSYFYFNNGGYVETGRVEVCPSIRQYTPVCMNAINNTFAQFFCNQVAYNSGKNLLLCTVKL